MKNKWLEPYYDSIIEALESDRLAHAYLISGPIGVGKRALVRALLPQLSGQAIALESEGWPAAADLYAVEQPKDKASIGIDQIRGLSEALAQTRYRAARKVAIVEPAQLMTLAAANALLKTLEEPSGETVLMLIADRLNSLPATIMSRCLHVRIATPTSAAGLAWLAEQSVQGNHEAALWLARGAPHIAQNLLESDAMPMAERCLTELGHLLRGRGDPVAIASHWYRGDLSTAWVCLSRATEEVIRQCQGLAATRSPLGEIPDNVRATVDLRNLFCYQDRLNHLRARPASGIDLQLALEALLLAWPQRFRRPELAAPLLAYPGAA